MSFLNTLNISASALTAQRFRMDIISQNMANIDTTRSAEDGEPYRRRLTVFQERNLDFRTSLDRAARRQLGVQSGARVVAGSRTQGGGGVRVAEVAEDESDFIPVYDPSHPDADEDGYVLMPNVDRTAEMVDLMAASRSYEANITAVNVIKTMAMKAAEITK